MSRFQPLPEYPTDYVHGPVLDRIMNRLGFPGDTANDPANPLVLVTRRTVLAYFAAGQDAYQSPGGGRKAKTRPHREAEGERYRTLRLILADWPDQPLGITEFAVACAIEDAHHLAVA